MKPKLHHVNFSTKNVAEMTEFYKRILLLESEKGDIPVLENVNSKLGGINMNYKPDIEPNLGVGEEKAAGCIKIVLLSATPSEMPLSVAKNNPCLFKPEIEIQT